MKRNLNGHEKLPQIVAIKLLHQSSKFNPYNPINLNLKPHRFMKPQNNRNTKLNHWKHTNFKLQNEVGCQKELCIVNLIACISGKASQLIELKCTYSNSKPKSWRQKGFFLLSKTVTGLEISFLNFPIFFVSYFIFPTYNVFHIYLATSCNRADW